jgi:hypothetical protein
MKAPRAANLASGQTAFLERLMSHNQVEVIGWPHTDFAIWEEISRNILRKSIRRNIMSYKTTYEGSAGTDEETISRNDDATS